MKILAPFTQDGFKESIEMPRFLRDLTNDQLKALVSIIGTSTVFIFGGSISEAGGNTTINSGIILKDSKLYDFSGGTYAGTPATLKVLFEENTASGYPKPYFEDDPIAKDIYLDRTCRIDASGTIFLNTIGVIYSLQTLKSKIGKDAWIDISAPGTTPVDGSFTAAVKTIRKYEDGTIQGVCFFTYTTARAVGTTVITLPNNGLNVELFQGYWTGGTDFNPVTFLLSGGGQLVLKTALPASGMRTLIFSFNYKLL